MPTLQMEQEDFHQMVEDSLPCIRPLAVLVFQPLVAAPSISISSSNKANMGFQPEWPKRAECMQLIPQQEAVVAHLEVVRFPPPSWISPVRTESLLRLKEGEEEEKEEQGLGKGEAKVGKVEVINKVGRVWRAGTMFTDSLRPRGTPKIRRSVQMY